MLNRSRCSEDKQGANRTALLHGLARRDKRKHHVAVILYQELDRVEEDHLNQLLGGKMSQRGINIVKDKIEDLELLIYGIEMRIYYGSGDQIHLTQKKMKLLIPISQMKIILK